MTGDPGGRYSWVKAPRYDGRPAETGPLAEALVGGDPLFRDLFARNGATTLVRQLARLTRPATIMPTMEAWIAEIAASGNGDTYEPFVTLEEGSGYGLIQAARGALGHWVTVRRGAITHYQVITPSAWNGSSRDCDGVRGPWEEALVGTVIADPDDPVEAGHVIRSFDPCLVCTVHAIDRRRETT